MPISSSTPAFLLTCLAAGLLGGGAMLGVMRLFSGTDWARGNMLVALGSLFTRSRTNALGLGTLLHAVSAVSFALGYTLVMAKLNLTHLPGSLMLGLGLGCMHGLLVSLSLVWIVAEQHPLEEFNEAGLAVGLSHFLGHVAYGGVVGLVIGCSPL